MTGRGVVKGGGRYQRTNIAVSDLIPTSVVCISFNCKISGYLPKLEWQQGTSQQGRSAREKSGAATHSLSPDLNYEIRRIRLIKYLRLDIGGVLYL